MQSTIAKGFKFGYELTISLVIFSIAFAFMGIVSMTLIIRAWYLF
jgi:hypothetical protein